MREALRMVMSPKLRRLVGKDWQLMELRPWRRNYHHKRSVWRVSCNLNNKSTNRQSWESKAKIHQIQILWHPRMTQVIKQLVRKRMFKLKRAKTINPTSKVCRQLNHHILVHKMDLKKLWFRKSKRQLILVHKIVEWLFHHLRLLFKRVQLYLKQPRPERP